MNTLNAQQSNRTEQKFFYGYIIVIAAFCIMLTTYGTNASFGVFFKPMSTELGWTRAITSGAFTFSIAISGLMGIVVGGLTDKLGPRLVITVCGFFIGLSFVLMSLTSVIWQLYLFFGVIRGIGMSGPWVSLTSTVARWFTRRRAMMTGIVLAGTGAGVLITSPVVSWLNYIYGWRTSYIILGSFIVLIVVLSAQFLKRDPTHKWQVPYGESKTGGQALQSSADIYSLRDAVRTRQLWLLFTMVFIHGFCLLIIMVHLVPHATDLGISVTSAANILASVGGVSIVGRVVLGNIADRIGNRQMFIVCFILISVALFWLVVAKELWMFYVFAVFSGFATGGLATLWPPLAAGLFGLSSHGLILGVVNLGFSIGGAVGPLFAGYIFDVTANYQLAFLVCATISIVGLILTLILRPIAGKCRQKSKIT